MGQSIGLQRIRHNLVTEQQQMKTCGDLNGKGIQKKREYMYTYS